jgi:hypothetical protein
MFLLRTQNRRRIVGTLLAVWLLLGAGCGRSRTVVTGDGKVSYQDKGKDAGTVTVTGQDGQTATVNYSDNKVPADYPKDVPVYSPAKVVMSQSTSEWNSHNLVMESPDASDKIAAFYKKGLEDNGWKTESAISTPQMTMLNGTKEQRQVVLQITDSDSKRSIMHLVADKR